MMNLWNSVLYLGMLYLVEIKEIYYVPFFSQSFLFVPESESIAARYRTLDKRLFLNPFEN